MDPEASITARLPVIDGWAAAQDDGPSAVGLEGLRCKPGCLVRGRPRPGSDWGARSEPAPRSPGFSETFDHRNGVWPLSHRNPSTATSARRCFAPWLAHPCAAASASIRPPGRGPSGTSSMVGMQSRELLRGEWGFSFLPTERAGLVPKIVPDRALVRRMLAVDWRQRPCRYRVWSCRNASLPPFHRPRP